MYDTSKPMFTTRGLEITDLKEVSGDRRSPIYMGYVPKLERALLWGKDGRVLNGEPIIHSLIHPRDKLLFLLELREGFFPTAPSEDWPKLLHDPHAVHVMKLSPTAMTSMTVLFSKYYSKEQPKS